MNVSTFILESFFQAREDVLTGCSNNGHSVSQCLPPNGNKMATIQGRALFAHYSGKTSELRRTFKLFKARWDSEIPVA